MRQGIFKVIFGNFFNTSGTQMKIWTSKNILKTNIAHMSSKFQKKNNSISKFQVFVFDFLHEKLQKSTFLKFYVVLMFLYASNY